MDRTIPDEQIGNRPIAIMNAYYFPDEDYSKIPDDITPVNTFRHIFREYFNINYEFLPQSSYYQTSVPAGSPELRNLDYIEIGEGQVEAPYTTPDSK